MVREMGLMGALEKAVREAFPSGTTLKEPAYPEQQHLYVRTPDGERYTVAIDAGPRGYSVSLVPDRFATRFAAARLDDFDVGRVANALKELFTKIL